MCWIWCKGRTQLPADLNFNTKFNNKYLVVSLDYHYPFLGECRLVIYFRYVWQEGSEIVRFCPY